MNTLDEQYGVALARYHAAFDRARELLPVELWRELDDAFGRVLVTAEEQALSHLVIALDTGSNVPRYVAAVSTAKAEPVEIDECDHRAVIRQRGAFDQPTAGRFEHFARGLLEYDLGNDAEGERQFAMAVGEQ